jgi:hypothetical protein
VGHFPRIIFRDCAFPHNNLACTPVKHLGNTLFFNSLRLPHFGASAAITPSTVNVVLSAPAHIESEAVMLRREAYLDRVVGEVEDLAARVALLKGRFAKQKVNVKLQHYWELEYVRTKFAEFRRRVSALEDAESDQLDHFQDDVESAWKDLMNAVETLLKVLP